jgi:hypothetical protein
MMLTGIYLVHMTDNKTLTIADLYPHLGDQELKDAEENLNRYLESAIRMYERIRQNPEEYTRFKTLTSRAADQYDGEGQRSNIISRT